MIIGSNIISLLNLPSTNTYAANLLKSEVVPEGTIIRTEFQSDGRGQKGNTWESEAGKNLIISIILHPENVAPSDQFLISMMISLGIYDFLKEEFPGCRIKWPNDIYVNDDKIAGILIENSIMDNTILNSIAGIGLNINQKVFLSDAPNPVSMSMITGKEYNCDDCFNALTDSLDKRHAQLKAEDYSNIRSDYKTQLYRLNEWSDFRDSDIVFKGRIVSVNTEGMLMIERQNGKIKGYSFKEVEFIL
jgi:BirA family biotin operon repressor/biotin-[acetyl-CoA-carboxylase] ligase